MWIIVSKCLEYYLAHMNTHYIRKPDHFSLNCFTTSKFCQIFYWILRFCPLHKQIVMSSWSRTIHILKSIIALIKCNFSKRGSCILKRFHHVFVLFIMCAFEKHKIVSWISVKTVISTLLCKYWCCHSTLWESCVAYIGVLSMIVIIDTVQ